MNPSGVRGRPVSGRFVQQSPYRLLDNKKNLARLSIERQDFISNAVGLFCKLTKIRRGVFNLRDGFADRFFLFT